MDDLLALLIQFVIEFVLNVLVDIPFEWPSRYRKTPERDRIAGICTFWLILGAALAGLSLLVFPRSLIAVPALRVANLLLAPFVSGLLSLLIARRRAETNPNIVPRNHFWQAFWFTLGLVAIRFAYTAQG